MGEKIHAEQTITKWLKTAHKFYYLAQKSKKETYYRKGKKTWGGKNAKKNL